MLGVPSAIGDRGLQLVESKAELRERIAELESENIVLKARGQRLEALLAENRRYRALLNSSIASDPDLTVARITSVSPDIQRHLVTVDRGKTHGIYEGDVVINAAGVMGQVVTAGRFASQVLLISDASHGLPVLNNRTGLRGVIEGTGRLDRLVIRNLASTADIVEGDLLVTSGLGGRFFSGYPVATVTETRVSGDAAYLTVWADPLADLDLESHVLILHSEQGESQAAQVDGIADIQ
ncbi:MAG: rod shape-determining protein MreC [Halieaceae bacterium MED-G27]|nr:MAG: rod shape-determining protein MreC [Halieaceae bacterium MED-G27]